MTRDERVMGGMEDDRKARSDGCLLLEFLLHGDLMHAMPGLPHGEACQKPDGNRVSWGRTIHRRVVAAFLSRACLFNTSI